MFRGAIKTRAVFGLLAAYALALLVPLLPAKALAAYSNPPIGSFAYCKNGSSLGICNQHNTTTDFYSFRGQPSATTTEYIGPQYGSGKQYIVVDNCNPSKGSYRRDIQAGSYPIDITGNPSDGSVGTCNSATAATETESTKVVNVSVSLKVDYAKGSSTTVGPLEVEMYDSRNTKYTATTNASPVNSNNVTLTAKFTGVTPGKYKFCIPGTTADCSNASTTTTATKTKGQVLQVSIRADAKDGAYTGGSSSEEANRQCAVNTFPLGWIVCPILVVVNKGVEKISGAILDLLVFDPNQSGLLPIWNSIKTLANLAFALIFLVIIFANTLSLNISNYAIKKMLPRLVAAVIFVQFSYFISILFIDIGNILGNGITALIGQVANSGSATGTSTNVVWAGIGSVLGLLTAVGVVAIVGVPAMLLIVGTVLIGLLGTFLTLMLRRLILSVLIVAAPLALAAWVLPNTENLFKSWYKNFTKLVLMFPLIAGILAVANAITDASAVSNLGNAKSVSGIVGGLMPAIALFAIPMTFKMSGSLMSGVSNAVIKRTSGLQGKLKGSQLAKDIKEQRKERGLQRTESDSKLMRAFGRAQSGTVAGAIPGIGRNTERRRQANFNKYLDDRGKEFETQFNAESLSNQETQPGARNGLEDIAMGRDARGIGRDAAARGAAIKMLMNRRDTKALDHIRGSAVGESAVWRQTLQRNFAEMYQTAPDIALRRSPREGETMDQARRAGQSSAFDSFTAEQFANMHQSTVGRLTQYLSTLPADSAVRQRALASIQTAFTSPALRSRITNESAGRVLSNAGLFDSVQTPGGVNGQAYIQRAVTPAGVSGNPPYQVPLGSINPTTPAGGQQGGGQPPQPPVGPDGRPPEDWPGQNRGYL